MGEDLIQYANVLKEIGAEQILKPDPITQVYLHEAKKDSLFKSLFYRVTDEKNIYSEPHTRNRESAFEQYSLLLNVKKLYGLFYDRPDGQIYDEDILLTRKTLFDGLLGKYSYSGLRRFTNSFGIFITVSNDTVPEMISKNNDTLNKADDGAELKFVASVKYLFDTIKLHPVEDGDGRVGRHIANFYLSSHSLRPLWVRDDRRSFASVADTYSFSDYLGAGLAFSIADYLLEKPNDSFIRTLTKLDTKDPSVKGLRDLILMNSGSNLTNDVKDEINFFYKQKDIFKEAGKVALYLMYLSGTSSGLLNRIYSSGDEKEQSLSILVAEKLRANKHVNFILKGLESESELVRIASVGVLGRNKLINNKLFKDILDKEDSTRVLGALGRAGRYMLRTDETVANLRKLINHESTDVKIGGYYGLINMGTISEISDILTADFNKCSPIVKKAITEGISNSEKINDPKIAKELAKLVLDNDETRHVLIGELTRKSHVAEEYTSMLRGMLKSDNSAERAYSIYLCGDKLGVKSRELSNMADRKGDKLTMQECLALSLVELKEQGRSPMSSNLNNAERRALYELGFRVSNLSDVKPNQQESSKTTEESDIVYNSIRKFARKTGKNKNSI